MHYFSLFAVLTVFLISSTFIVDSCFDSPKSAASVAADAAAGSSSGSGSASSLGLKWLWKCGKYKFKGLRKKLLDGSFSGEGDWYVDGKIVYSGFMSGHHDKASRKFKLGCGAWKAEGEGDEQADGSMSGSCSITNPSGEAEYTGDFSAGDDTTSDNSKEYNIKCGGYEFSGKGTQNADGTFTVTGELKNEAGEVIYSGECTGTYDEATGTFKVTCGEFEISGTAGGTATVSSGGETLYTGECTASAADAPSDSSSSSDSSSEYNIKCGGYDFNGKGTKNADGTFTVTAELKNEAGESIYSGECTGTYDEATGEFKVTCGEFDLSGSAGGTATVSSGGATLYTGPCTASVADAPSDSSSSSGSGTLVFSFGEWSFEGTGEQQEDGSFSGEGELKDETGEILCTCSIHGSFKDGLFTATAGEFTFSGTFDISLGAGSCEIKKGSVTVYSGEFHFKHHKGGKSGSSECESTEDADSTEDGSKSQKSGGSKSGGSKSGGSKSKSGCKSGGSKSGGSKSGGSKSGEKSGGSKSGGSKSGESGEGDSGGSGQDGDGGGTGGGGGGAWTFSGSGTMDMTSGSFSATGEIIDEAGVSVYSGDIEGAYNMATGEFKANGGEWTATGTGQQNADGSISGEGEVVDASGAVLYSGSITITITPATVDVDGTATADDSASGGGDGGGGGGGGSWSFSGSGTMDPTSGSFSATGEIIDAAGESVFTGEIVGVYDFTSGEFKANGGDWTATGSGLQNADGSISGTGEVTDAAGEVVFSGSVSIAITPSVPNVPVPPARRRR